METKLCECGCGKQVKNDTSKYLSGHSNRDPKIQEQKKLKCLAKYGVDHPSKLQNIKEKTKQTCLSRYGTSTNLINIKHKEKNRQIIVDKYGVDNPFKSNQIKKKIKETNIRLYGVENPAMSKEIKEQKKQNSILKYGVESPNQLEQVKEKKKATCLKNYGVDSPSRSSIIWNKYRETCILKYGVDHWNKTEQAKQSSRINYVRMIENQKLNGEPLTPRIGDDERPFLNVLQQYTEHNIVRNDNSFRYIVGRFPDGHIPELKLFIQFDERSHFENREMTIYKQDDLDCTLELASMGYVIFRVSGLLWEKDPEAIINQFKLLLDLLKTEPN